MALAVVGMMALTLIPPYAMAWVPFLVATFQGMLLVTLIAGDPGRIDDRSRRVRRLSITLVGLLLATALVSTALVVYDLVSGSPETSQPGPLLLVGGKVWLLSNIAFAILYWQVDSGGPAERAHALRAHPDLGFPQLMSPDIAPPGWRPRFSDYLYLSFTTANAFSPTDTPPLARWAKVAMGSQALISFVVVGLVIARAVNVFR
jgi:uncharacterized membrane protein